MSLYFTDPLLHLHIIKFMKIIFCRQKIIFEYEERYQIMYFHFLFSICLQITREKEREKYKNYKMVENIISHLILTIFLHIYRSLALN